MSPTMYLLSTYGSYKLILPVWMPWGMKLNIIICPWLYINSNLAYAEADAAAEIQRTFCKKYQI